MVSCLSLLTADVISLCLYCIQGFLTELSRAAATACLAVSIRLDNVVPARAGVCIVSIAHGIGR